MAKVLKLPLVKERSALGKSTIYDRIKAGTFPKPIKIGARAVGWLEADIDEWIAEQIERSRKSETAAV